MIKAVRGRKKRGQRGEEEWEIERGREGEGEPKISSTVASKREQISAALHSSGLLLN